MCWMAGAGHAGFRPPQHAALDEEEIRRDAVGQVLPRQGGPEPPECHDQKGQGTDGDFSDDDEQRAPGEEHADGASGRKEEQKQVGNDRADAEQRLGRRIDAP
jgi:hypothetical protein